MVRYVRGELVLGAAAGVVAWGCCRATPSEGWQVRPTTCRWYCSSSSAGANFMASIKGSWLGSRTSRWRLRLPASHASRRWPSGSRAQPTPRTHSILSRYFEHIFVVVLPFALIGAASENAWVVIPATVIVEFAFRMAQRIGAVVEQPFGGTIQDVPLSAICTELERDLLELVGDEERPPRPEPAGGDPW